jgi:methionine biosynthesis protein MetW
VRGLLSAAAGRADFSPILGWVKPGSSVLDLGCGEGDLLARLISDNGAQGMGVDNDIEKVVACVRKGIPVVQKDLNRPLSCFETGSYDYVIVSQTIHQVAQPDDLMQEVLRIGRNAVLSFPNFGHVSLRLQLTLGGKMPKSKTLPFEWYRTPNIHLLTLADFAALCRRRGVRILDRVYFLGGRLRRRLLWPNLLAEGGVFLLTR